MVTVLEMDHSKKVDGPGCSAEQQKEPRTLEIGHLRHPFQKDSVFLNLLGQRTLHKFCAAKGSAEDRDALHVAGECWVSTHRCETSVRSLDLSPHMFHTNVFSLVHVEPGVVPKVYFNRLSGAQLRDGNICSVSWMTSHSHVARSGQRCACLFGLRTRANIHGGKTKVWNRVGVQPPNCDVLEHITRANDPRARVSRV